MDILLVSSAEKSRDAMLQMLRTASYTPVTMASSGSEARRMLAQKDFELVLIVTPLSDEFGQDLAFLVTQTTMAGVILMVKADIADSISYKLEGYGVAVLPKPVGKLIFFQTLRLVSATSHRMAGLRQENLKLQQKIAEIRLVDRAKCALIQYLNMTEQQAHRYIEKQAMDLRCTRAQVAESILTTYET